MLSHLPFPSSTVHTYSDPLTAHINHLAHLSRPKSLKPVLTSRHKHSSAEANALAIEISDYVSQGIDLYHDSTQCSKGTKPILQYYSYLNFATACILCHKPQVSKPLYRRHGASDTTHSVDALKLNSKVIKINNGALSEFHKITSQQSITGLKFRLVDLLMHIQILEPHLKASHKIAPQRVCVEETFVKPNNNRDYLKHKIGLNFYATNAPNMYKAFPRAKIEACFPFLKSHYTALRGSKAGVTYHSKETYPLSAWQYPPKEIHKIMLLLHDFAGLLPEQMEVGTTWSVSKNTQIVPGLTASMLLSFSLASIYRYRPTLVRKMPASKLAILLDSFIDESPFVMLPTFRSLLYREFLVVKRRTISS